MRGSAGRPPQSARSYQPRSYPAEVLRERLVLQFARPEVLLLLLLLPAWGLFAWPRAGRGVLFSHAGSVSRPPRSRNARGMLLLAGPATLRSVTHCDALLLMCAIAWHDAPMADAPDTAPESPRNLRLRSRSSEIPRRLATATGPAVVVSEGRSTIKVPGHSGRREFSTRTGIRFLTAGAIESACRTCAP